jgi:DNA-binding NarL/FixJ family response regulator
MRVAIAEDRVLLREGVAQLLTDADIEVTARCGTADELLARVAQDQPDAVIVDIRLPPTHTDEGMRAALTIRKQYPDVGVLVLSQYVEVGLAMQLLADSAEGVYCRAPQGCRWRFRAGSHDRFDHAEAAPKL